MVEKILGVACLIAAGLFSILDKFLLLGKYTATNYNGASDPGAGDMPAWFVALGVLLLLVGYGKEVMAGSKRDQHDE